MVVLFYTVLYLGVSFVFLLHMWFQWMYNDLVLCDTAVDGMHTDVSANSSTNVKPQNQALPILRVRL